MKNSKIEKDLFNILKSKSKDEIYYTIFSMINGTYEYELGYLNGVSYELKMNYIEKFLMVCSSTHAVKTDEDIIKAILRFSRRIQSVEYEYMRKSIPLNLKYDLKAFKMSLNPKKYTRQFSLIILSIFLVTKGVTIEAYDDTVDYDDYDFKESIEASISSDYAKKFDDESVSEIVSNKITFEKDFIDNSKMISRVDATGYSEVIPTGKVELTNEEKIETILDKYGLSKEEFDVLSAIVLAEAEANSYEDAYAVINTIYNRTITQSWVYEINKIRGENAGRSLYYQAIHPNQFVVYQEGFYLGMVGITDVPGYQAIIDFLYTEDAIHEYLSFRSCDSNLVVSYEQFSSNGNKYFNLIRDEDRISDEILVASNTRY